MNAGRGGDHQDPELEALRRQYPRWRIWRGTATGGYWALPPRDHPTVRDLIGASDLGELAASSPRRRGGMAYEPSVPGGGTPLLPGPAPAVNGAMRARPGMVITVVITAAIVTPLRRRVHDAPDAARRDGDRADDSGDDAP